MHQYRHLSDYELVSLIGGQDAYAINEIYERYWTVLYLYACKFAGDTFEAEDIVQEVIISLWHKSPKLHLHTSLSSYLYSCVRYKVIDKIKHQKVKDKFVRLFQNFIDAEHPIADSSLREKELIRLIENEIRKLPPKMREVFELSRKEELSQKEIAEKLNISDKTVKKQINKALKVLKLKITPYVTLLLLFLLFFVAAYYLEASCPTCIKEHIKHAGKNQC